MNNSFNSNQFQNNNSSGNFINGYTNQNNIQNPNLGYQNKSPSNSTHLLNKQNIPPYTVNNGTNTNLNNLNIENSKFLNNQRNYLEQSRTPNQPNSYQTNSINQAKLQINSKQSSVLSNYQDLLTEHYNNYQKKYLDHGDKIEISTNSVIALCTYVIPTLAFFIIVFKYTSSFVDIQKHARQSAILQILWLTVLYILNSTGLPLIAGNGITLATLWNIIYIGVSIRAGASAYLGDFYKIPLIFDVASNFIEGNSKT